VLMLVGPSYFKSRQFLILELIACLLCILASLWVEIFAG